MLAKADLGYDQSAISWTHPTVNKSIRTTEFFTEYEQMGERFIALLNAAKRAEAHNSAAAIRNVIDGLRQLVRAIMTYSSADASPQEWLTAFAHALRVDGTAGSTTLNGYYKYGVTILRELARYENIAITIPANPYKRRKVTAVKFLEEAELERIVNKAKSDVYAYVLRFRSPNPDHVGYIEELRAMPFTRHGLGSRDKNSHKTPLYKRWREETGLQWSDLTSYVYPGLNELAPFLLVMGYQLAGNPDSVTFMLRNSITPMSHPIHGSCYKLDLEKPRSGTTQEFLIRNKVTLSIGWMVDAILELTQALVPYAHESHQKYAFLAMTAPGAAKPLVGGSRWKAIKNYLDTHDLPQVTLKALRTHRAVFDFNRHGDIFRTRRLLQHQELATSASYLDQALTHDRSDATIADLQMSMPQESPTNGTAASYENELPATTSNGHSCSNPFDATKPHDENGFCSSYLWPFNDRCFVFDFSPRPVAFLLRDYAALCDAQFRLPAVRFELIYAQRKVAIETTILPYISAELRKRAEALLSSLPLAPTIE